VTIVRGIVKIFSYSFHLVLALFLMGMSIVALSSGLELQLGMFPWQSGRLAVWVLILNLVGIGTILLALSGKVRVLFPAWSLAVLIGMIRGFFLGPYNFFSGPLSFSWAIYLTLAAILASIGAWLQYRKAPAQRKLSAAAR
jgi:hypothetical protein